MIKNIIRALRLPFISASVLPFVFGSVIFRSNFNFTGFFLGLIAAVSAHLSANLINDYCDSKSGADWKDKDFYGFFGGSKLIQEGVLSEGFYFWLAVMFAALSLSCVILLAVNLKNFSVLGYFACIIFLAWAYSQKPLQLSYRRAGELVILLLFGPALVMGGYFIQTQVFPDLKSFILSLPMGLLVTAILFANEVPDFTSDKETGKFTWVSITGPARAHSLYLLLVSLNFVFVVISVYAGYLRPIALASVLFLLLGFRAAGILKKYHADKLRLVESSKLTIMLHTLVSIILIISAL